MSTSGGRSIRYYVRDPRGRKAALWLAALGFPLLFILMNSLWDAKGGVQDRLTKATRSRLAAAGIPADRYQLHYDGQIAYFTGNGLTDSQIETLKDVRNLSGVQEVKIRNTPPAAPAPAPVPATTLAPTTTAAPATTAPPATTLAPTTTAAPRPVVDAKATLGGDGRITLTGTVLSAAQKTAIVQAAQATFGPARVIDQLRVQAPEAATPASDGAVRKMGELIGLMKINFVTGEVGVRDTALTITGVAPGDPARSAFTAAGEGARTAGLTPTTTITVAAPAAAAEDLRKKLAEQLTISGIYFATNSAEISAESISILDGAAQYINATPASITVEVGGHTDNVGGAASNLTLSQRRATAVQEYLISKGVNAARLSAVGYGLTQPIADNSTEEGRAVNRRIQFTVGG